MNAVLQCMLNQARKDNGGAVYILPSQEFDFDEHKGLGIYEWTHNGPVIPILKIDFSSAVAAMQKFGVKIYFVTQDQFFSIICLYQEIRKNNSY